MYGIKPQRRQRYLTEQPAHIKKCLRGTLAVASLFATVAYYEMCKQTDRALSMAIDTANVRGCPLETLDSKNLYPKMFGVIPFHAKVYVTTSDQNLHEVDAVIPGIRIKDLGSSEHEKNYIMINLAAYDLGFPERPKPSSPEQQKLCQ